jgi:O-antigen/teichoic acid export membrane protein
MRRRVPWLSLGSPTRSVEVRRRLSKPALASAGIAWGTGTNIQAMVVLVSVVIGPASAAVFATVRAVSRIAIQLASAIAPAVGPELARGFGLGDQALLRRFQRRITQVGVWSAVVMVMFIGALGDWLISTITRGTVIVEGWLLSLLLLSAVVEVAWLTSAAILFNTNRHGRVGLAYVIASTANLGLAYVFLRIWGIDGAALSLVILALVMLVVVMKHSLPATNETVRGWITSLVDPREIRDALTAVRAKLARS